MKKITILILTAFLLTISAQNKLKFFADDLLIQPYTANMIEPKLGFVFQVGNNELRLDIGNSIDIMRYDLSECEELSFGADLFTYTLLRGEQNFHFPVDAVDYLFGVNFGYVKKAEHFDYGARLRISHISAHFVDGHFDNTAQQWRKGRNPRVYSREFFEFMPFVKYQEIRFYAGLTYLIHTTPSNIGKDIYQLGFDYFWKNGISEGITPFIAYDFRLENIFDYTGTNSFNTGIKFGKANGKGFSIYFHYFAGKSVHGEYYDYNKKYSAIGINLDL